MRAEKILFYFYADFNVLSLPGNQKYKCLTRADFLKGKLSEYMMTYRRVEVYLNASLNLALNGSEEPVPLSGRFVPWTS
jgi:hypothetical protein